MFGAGRAVRALGLGFVLLRAAGKGVLGISHTLGTWAARGGLLAKEEAKRPSSWFNSLEAENNIRAPSTAQPVSKGPLLPTRRDFYVIIPVFNPHEQSQNLCFLELLALLFG